MDLVPGFVTDNTGAPTANLPPPHTAGPPRTAGLLSIAYRFYLANARHGPREWTTVPCYRRSCRFTLRKPAQGADRSFLHAPRFPVALTRKVAAPPRWTTRIRPFGPIPTISKWSRRLMPGCRAPIRAKPQSQFHKIPSPRPSRGKPERDCPGCPDCVR